MAFTQRNRDLKAAPCTALRDKLQATSSQQGGIIPAHALDYNVI